jgi:uncharacterized protein YeaO (DUF488 family)
VVVVGILKTKSIQSPREPNDGLRISIMSRHAMDDGVTSDPRITVESYDAWCPQLAPLSKLIGDYRKRGLSSEVFERRFISQIASSPLAQRWLKILVNYAHTSNVTLLYIEDGPERCHRRLIAEACLKIDPRLEVIIK